MTQPWSKEPWKYIEHSSDYKPTDDECYHGAFVDANEEGICWFGNSEAYYPSDGEEPSQADTERIIACVNGCTGLNPAAYRECVQAIQFALADPNTVNPNTRIVLQQALHQAEEQG